MYLAPRKWNTHTTDSYTFENKTCNRYSYSYSLTMCDWQSYKTLILSFIYIIYSRSGTNYKYSAENICYTYIHFTKKKTYRAEDAMRPLIETISKMYCYSQPSLVRNLSNAIYYQQQLRLFEYLVWDQNISAKPPADVTFSMLIECLLIACGIRRVFLHIIKLNTKESDMVGNLIHHRKHIFRQTLKQSCLLICCIPCVYSVYKNTNYGFFS